MSRYTYAVPEAIRDRLEAIKTTIEQQLGISVTHLSVITFLLNFYEQNKDKK
jgi:hypothetical protein